MSATTDSLTVDIARDAIGIATRMRGRKRGFFIAAKLLGVSERVVRAIAYGEPARPDAIAAARARLELAQQRLAQLEAEASDLRRLINASSEAVGVARD